MNSPFAPPTVVSYPFAVFNIELTNECPMKCVMCPRTNNMTRDIGFMDFGLFTKVIDELVEANPEYAAKNEVWLHHFGESLTHPDFPKFIAYASSKGVYACLSINPIMLNLKVSRALLEARPSKLLISLDGHDDESFENIRGVKRAYTRSKENLLRFLELKKELKSKTKVIMSMINFELNQESINEMSSYWRGVEGIDQFLNKPFVNWNGDANDVNRFKNEQNTPAPLEKVTCGYPWDKMTIAWDGDVVPCCYDYDKKYVLGNVRQESLASIWNGPKMRALRREFSSNKVENPLCKSCDYLRAPYEATNLRRAHQYECGSQIDFGITGSSDFFRNSGWSLPENWGTWTDGESAEIALTIDDKKRTDLVLEMECRAFVGLMHPEIEASVSANGQHLDTWKFLFDSGHGGDHTRSIVIPSAVREGSPKLKIRLGIRGARSPQELRISADPRKLGLGVRKMSFFEVCPPGSKTTNHVRNVQLSCSGSA
jgi:radical SAM protein with 4Fe4S-binding SPASM domain